MPKNRMMKLLEALPEPKPKVLPKQSMGKMQGTLNKKMPSLGQIAKDKQGEQEPAQDKPGQDKAQDSGQPSGEPGEQQRQKLVKLVMNNLTVNARNMLDKGDDLTTAGLLYALIGLIKKVTEKQPELTKFVAKDIVDQYGNKFRGSVKVGLKKHFDLAY